VCPVLRLDNRVQVLHGEFVPHGPNTQIESAQPTPGTGEAWLPHACKADMRWGNSEITLGDNPQGYALARTFTQFCPCNITWTVGVQHNVSVKNCGALPSNESVGYYVSRLSAVLHCTLHTAHCVIPLRWSDEPPNPHIHSGMRCLLTHIAASVFSVVPHHRRRGGLVQLPVECERRRVHYISVWHPASQLLLLSGLVVHPVSFLCILCALAIASWFLCAPNAHTHGVHNTCHQGQFYTA
jgi:hypothetical protein